MTDRQRLEEMFDRAGVKYDYVDGAIEVKAVGEKEGPNLGYMDFVGVFTFDDQGALVSVGLWE